MNKEDYVSLEVAKLLKEKGYHEPCKSAYDRDGNIGEYTSVKDWNAEYDWTFSRPTLYEAQKWIREEHKLHIEVGMYGDYSTDADGNKVDEYFCWGFDVYNKTRMYKSLYDDDGGYNSYEEALNEGILEALKLI